MNARFPFMSPFTLSREQSISSLIKSNIRIIGNCGWKSSMTAERIFFWPQQALQVRYWEKVQRTAARADGASWRYRQCRFMSIADCFSLKNRFWHCETWNGRPDFANTCHSVSVSVRKSRSRRTKRKNVTPMAQCPLVTTGGYFPVRFIDERSCTHTFVWRICLHILFPKIKNISILGNRKST